MRISFFCGKFGKSVQKKNGLGYNIGMNKTELIVMISYSLCVRKERLLGSLILLITIFI